MGEAPVADLYGAFEKGLGRGAVAELMGDVANGTPECFSQASPIDLLPFGIPQLVLQGTDDDAVPLELTQAYAVAARAAGDSVEFKELPDTDHMAFLHPESTAHATVRAWLGKIL